MTTSVGGCVVKLAKSIANVFGKERAALYEAMIEHLVENGYVKEDIGAFLETYALPLGTFDILSMLMRSRLNLKNLEKSLFFLLNRHVVIVEALSKYLKPNYKILDVGCGRGTVTCSLALKGFEVHGIDISMDAIEIAKKLAGKLGCKPTFYLIEEDKLPFSEAYFDAALCVWTLHEVSPNRMLKLLMELHRTLREMGNVFIIDQERVAPFEVIKNNMNQIGFKLDFEESLLTVYDHGKVSQALMLKYVKEP
jgi:ubiquinone/menaquinone biosynthesis C-methylase UbiE